MTTDRAPLSVYMLADHLDGLLAAGEDLMAEGRRWRELFMLQGEPLAFSERHRRIADEVRGNELILIARVLKARDHASALAGHDPKFAPIARLFVSATGILIDAVDECGDATRDDFETGDTITAYVRSRGLIAPDARAITSSEYLAIDDNFLVAKRLMLGPLMDMAAAFLDALESEYELFVKPEARKAVTPKLSETGPANSLPLN